MFWRLEDCLKRAKKVFQNQQFYKVSIFTGWITSLWKCQVFGWMLIVQSAHLMENKNVVCEYLTLWSVSTYLWLYDMSFFTLTVNQIKWHQIELIQIKYSKPMSTNHYLPQRAQQSVQDATFSVFYPGVIIVFFQNVLHHFWETGLALSYLVSVCTPPPPPHPPTCCGSEGE